MSLYKVFLEAKYCLNAILIVLKKLLKCKCEKILETQSVLIKALKYCLSCFYISHLLNGISVKIFNMNQYLSKSYTKTKVKDKIDQQHKERGQLQCQLLKVLEYRDNTSSPVVSGIAIVLNFLATKPLQSKSSGPYTVPCNV